MCAVKATCLFREAESFCGVECRGVFCSVNRVEWKPRTLRLRETSGNITNARKNSICAGRSGALNRRRLSSISGRNLQQAMFDEMADEFGQVRAQQFGVHVIFGEEFLVRSINIRRGCYQLPHARAGLIKAEIHFRFQVEQNRFLIQKPYQDVCGCGSSILKCQHRHGSSYDSCHRGHDGSYLEEYTGDCAASLRRCQGTLVSSPHKSNNTLTHRE